MPSPPPKEALARQTRTDEAVFTSTHEKRGGTVGASALDCVAWPLFQRPVAQRWRVRGARGSSGGRTAYLDRRGSRGDAPAPVASWRCGHCLGLAGSMFDMGCGVRTGRWRQTACCCCLPPCNSRLSALKSDGFFFVFLPPVALNCRLIEDYRPEQGVQALHHLFASTMLVHGGPPERWRCPGKLR